MIATQIHKDLDCTNFKEANCTFDAALDDLLNRTPAFEQHQFPANVSDVVFWRY